MVGASRYQIEMSAPIIDWMHARRWGLLVIVVITLFIGVRLHTNAVGRYAVLLAQSGQEGLALGIASTLTKISPTAISFAALGDVYLEAQDYHQALNAYQETLYRDLHYPSAHYKRARMLFVLGNFSGSVAEATAELDRNPGHVGAKYIRGLAYSYQTDWGAAEKDFTDLLSFNPHWPWTRIDLSWAYLSQGKYDAAETLLRETLEKTPGNAWALNNLGLAFLHKGRYDEAMDRLTQALAVVETMEPEQFVTAYPLQKLSQFPAGREQLKQGILFNTAVLLEKRGELARAREVYQQVLSLAERQEMDVSASINGVSTQTLRVHLNKLGEREGIQ